MLTGSVLRAVVLGMGMLALMQAVVWVWRRRAAQTVARDRGRIGPSKTLISALLLALLSFAALPLYAFAEGSGGIEALVAATGALLMAAALAACLLPIYDVVWSARGIEGPTSLWFPPIGPRRSFIAWADVAVIGQDKGWFVQDRQGRRIRWNHVYADHPALTLHLERALPWLQGELPVRATEKVAQGASPAEG